MDRVFLGLLIFIACLDVLRHKIYNISLLALVIFGSLAGFLHFDFSMMLFAVFFALVLGFMRAGGGDTKFAIIALPLFLPPGMLGRYLTYFSIIAATQLIIQGTYFIFFRRLSFKSQHMALAPALAGALAFVII